MYCVSWKKTVDEISSVRKTEKYRFIPLSKKAFVNAFMINAFISCGERKSTFIKSEELHEAAFNSILIIFEVISLE